MARARNIKPAIMDNEDLSDFDPLTRLLFVYLWMLADREGRLEDRPKRIAAQALPYDRAVDVESMLNDLNEGKFINRYEIKAYRVIQITSFLKHQTPHGTEKDSVLPDESGMFKVHVRGNNGYATGEFTLSHEIDSGKKQSDNSVLTVKELSINTLIPDSLIPDSSLTSVSEGTQSAKPPAQPRGSRLDPDWVLPKAWGDWALSEFPHWSAEDVRQEALKFKDHWLSEAGSKARKQDWQATWRKWCRSDIAQRAHATQSQTGETLYQRSMRLKVEQAAGSMAHVVAAKPAGYVKKPEPWDVAANDRNRTITDAMGGQNLLEIDG